MAETGCEAVRDLLRRYADSAPYAENLFAPVDDRADPGTDLGHVPMARVGGFPAGASARDRRAAARALQCDPDALFVLYDGPVDPEPWLVPDPARSGFTIFIERARLETGDFDATYAC